MHNQRKCQFTATSQPVHAIFTCVEEELGLAGPGLARGLQQQVPDAQVHEADAFGQAL